MNFLAHLYLADPTPASRIGNLLPDLCRVRTGMPLAPEVATGVLTHRRVDALTDAHPIFARSKARVFAHSGRFSGIVIDVLYDHFLTRDWSRYSDTPLPTFIASVHDDFREHPHLMPTEVRPILTGMVDQDWLLAYGDVDGLRLCFRRMSMRFSERFGREVSLESAADLLEEHGDALRADFAEFFPQLVASLRNRQPPMAATAAAC